jgi:hypothetical protein
LLDGVQRTCNNAHIYILILTVYTPTNKMYAKKKKKKRKEKKEKKIRRKVV